MSLLPEPAPQRIGDAERDQAAEALREHLAAGRLAPEEFDDRLGRALNARTVTDLRPLFEDLPGPKPGSGPTPVPLPNESTHRRPGTGPLAVAASVAWPLTIMLCFIVGWQFWWLIFIPIAISSIAGSRTKHGGH